MALQSKCERGIEASQVGVEVSRAEPKLGIAQARLDNIELGSWLDSITNEPDFKAQAQARLTRSSQARASL